MKNNLIKKCIAEFLGTFALVFFGCGSMILHQINPNAIGAPLCCSNEYMKLYK